MDETILHEADVRDVIDDEIADKDDVTPQAEPTGVLTNASTSHALNSVFDDTEVEAALNALGTKFNTNGTKLQDLIDKLVTAGVLTD